MIKQDTFTYPTVDTHWHLEEETDCIHPNTNVKRTLFGLNVRAVHDQLEITGDGVTVAIIDSGADSDHPRLKGAIENERSTNLELYRLKGATAAEDRRIYNPLDAHGTALAGIVAGRPPDPNSPEAAMGPQSRFSGVAPGAELMVIRLFTNFQPEQFLKALERAEEADVLLLARTFPQVEKAIRPTDNTAESPEGRIDAPDPNDRRSRAGTDRLFREREEGYTKIQEKLKELATSIPVVCAAGNGSFERLSFPASLDETISVGAVNELGWRSTYSQFGEKLDVVAPSSDAQMITRDMARLRVSRTDNDNHERLSLKNNRGEIPRGAELPPENNAGRLGYFGIVTTDNSGDSGYTDADSGFANFTPLAGPRRFGGTSAAAAQVAGVVALMLSANKKLKGEPQQVKKVLRDSASTDNLFPEDKKTFKQEFGSGRVDALKAVRRAKNWPVDEPSES